jgi:hypothetical protein
MHIIPLYDFRLDMVRKVLLGKMCVCEEKKKKNMKKYCTWCYVRENG